MDGSARDSGHSPAALETLIRKGKSPEDFAAFFHGMDEKRRRALAPAVIEVARDLTRDNDLLRVNPAVLEEAWAWSACAPALLATASLGELKRLGNRGIPTAWRPGADASITILLDRAPPWLDKWCDWLIDRSALHWPLVRRLVREAPCSPPEHPNYVLGMIAGLTWNPTDQTVLDGLLADRELLETLVWRLFETEGTSEMRLSQGAGAFDDRRGWAHALRQLSILGELDRGRLLNASLDALSRDLDPEQTGWFVRFHDYLEPTEDERAAALDRYLANLANPASTALGMAIRSLRALQKASRLDAGQFLDRIEPALYSQTKGNAKGILQILAGIAGEQEAMAETAMLSAAALLEHPETEIQELALDLLERSGDSGNGSIRDAVEQRLPVMAASMRNRAAAWIGAPALAEALQPAADDAELYEGIARATDLPSDVATWFGLDSVLAELRHLAGTVPAIRQYPPQGERKLTRLQIRQTLKKTGEFLLITLAAILLSPFIVVGLTVQLLLWIVFVLLLGYGRERRRTKKPYRAPFSRMTAETIFGQSDRWHRLLLFLMPRRAYMRDIAWSADTFESRGSGSAYLGQAYRLAMEPGIPFGPLGALMVCLDLQLADPSRRQLATDLLIDTVEGGKLDGAMIGGALKTLFGHGVIRPRRLAPELARAGGTSPLHAQVLREALTIVLPAIVALPRDSHLMLEHYYELCVETQETVTNPDHRTLLSEIEGSGKPAKAAGKLLALEEGDPLPHRRAAAFAALDGRLARAERWAGR